MEIYVLGTQEQVDRISAEVNPLFDGNSAYQLTFSTDVLTSPVTQGLVLSVLVKNERSNFSGTVEKIINRLKYELVRDAILANVPAGEGVVYKAVTPSGKIYVGKTKFQLKHRVGRHCYMAIVEDKKEPFANAVRKYQDKIVWSILHSDLNDDVLNQKEQEYIALFKSTDPQSGYNITAGGPGWHGCNHTPECREKSSKKRKGKPAWNKGRTGLYHHTEEAKKVMSEHPKKDLPKTEKFMKRLAEHNASGWQHSPEVVAKIKEALTGRPVTQEFRDTMSEVTQGEKNGMFGKNHSDEAKKAMSEGHKKRYQENPELGRKLSEAKSKSWVISDTGQRFTNDREAARVLGIPRSRVRQLIIDGVFKREMKK